MRARSFTVLKKPYLSEKSYLLSQFYNTYTFVIERRATKDEVKSDVERLFNVKVDKVRTVQGRDKKKRVGKYSGIKKGQKRAIVTLKEGYSLDFFGEVEKKSEKEIAKEEKKQAKVEAKEAKTKETKVEAKVEKAEVKEEKKETKDKEEEEVKDAG